MKSSLLTCNHRHILAVGQILIPERDHMFALLKSGKDLDPIVVSFQTLLRPNT